MIWKVVLTASTVAFAFAGTWAADQYGVNEPYNGLVVEFLGAAVVAVLTWALVSVPKRRRLFLELKDIHIRLLKIWRDGPSAEESQTVKVRHFVAVQRGNLPNAYGLSPKVNEAATIYGEKLLALLQTQEGPVASRAPKYVNMCKTYAVPWNECHNAFAKLARELTLVGHTRVWIQRSLFVIKAAADRDNPEPSKELRATDDARARQTTP